MNDKEFKLWMNDVDQCLLELVGLKSNDLADQTWRDWFDDEMEPMDAARECLDNENFPYE